MIDLSGGRVAGRKLFRWTLAGRLKFLDDVSDVLNPVEVFGLPGTAVFVQFPAVRIVLAEPVQSLAQRILAQVAALSKAVVGIPCLLIKRYV